MTEHPGGTDAVLDVRHLSVGFPTRHGPVAALQDLSFAISGRETVGLIGESGSGKTTAVKAILRLLSPTARTGGAVSFLGHDLSTMPEPDLRRLRWTQLALVPQAAMNSLDPVQPVDKQIIEAIRTHRDISRRDALGMAHDALDRVGIHPNRAGGYPHQFSGGMRQRALIAMATILEPALLIADEPTTGLDVIVQDRILDLLTSAKRAVGSSMLLVTHDLGVAAEVCDRVIVLRHGTVVESGPVTEVFGNPTHEYTRQLMDPAPSSRRPRSFTAEDSGVPAVRIENARVTYSTGRGLSALRNANRVDAVEDVSLEVRPGEIVGIAGESGCGKSSLASALVGLTDLAEGSVAVEGERFDAEHSPDWRHLRSKMQLIFQDPYQSLNPRFTVRRAVEEPLLAQLQLSEDETNRRVDSALESAELKPVEKYAERRPHELSGGERQRVAIARALVLQPRVLIADEPVSMLDHSTGREIISLLRRLADDRGVAVLLVSHDLSMLRQVCDRIAVMYLGRVVESGPTADVLDTPQHPYTEALRAAVPSRTPMRTRSRVLLAGEPPSVLARPPGCAFHPRCPIATPGQCHTNAPPLDGEHHEVACWNATPGLTITGTVDVAVRPGKE